MRLIRFKHAQNIECWGVRYVVSTYQRFRRLYFVTCKWGERAGSSG